ncbi:MAG TPA: hypothetical protein VF791_11415 [Pyrinomonadaceae bacterium]
MGELSEELWAVLSERGCEASSLSYAQAAELMRRLKRERVSGLCVITNDAARRVSLTENSRTRPSPSNGGRPIIRKS